MDIEQLVTTAASQDRETFEWGEIIWLDGHDLTGTDALTTGDLIHVPEGASNRATSTGSEDASQSLPMIPPCSNYHLSG